MASLSSIDWNDVIDKEARSSNNEDLGEVQKVDENFVFVQRGMISKDKFYIPIDMVESYDGTILRFRISEEDATARFLRLDK
jgi:hypothetical protein